MKVKSLSSLLCLSLLMSLNVSAKITQVSDGYEVLTCNFPVGAQFTVTLPGVNPLKGQVNAEGCVKTTFRNGTANPGDNVTIMVDGMAARREQVPRSSSGGPVVVQPSQPAPRPQPAPVQQAPQQPVQQQPVQAQLPSVDLIKVQQQGAEAARMMANRIVSIYGTAENINYNLYMVFSDIAARAAAGNYLSSADYILGVQQGQAQGRNDGEVAGQNSGSASGSRQGSDAAYGRFDEKGIPDLTFKAPTVLFNGLADPMGVPPGIKQRLADQQASILQSLTGIPVSFDGYTLSLQDYWSVNQYSINGMFGWQAYPVSAARDRFPADLALQKYLDKSLGGNYNLSYYNRIGDSSQTLNAAQAKTTFDNAFLGTYDNEINSKWANAVRKDNYQVQRIASEVGQQVLNSFARDMGTYQGRSQTFQAASVTGFNQTFTTAYVNGFKNEAAYLNDNVIISKLSAHILDSQKSVQNFIPGLPIYVVVDDISNIGGVNGQINVNVTGSSIANGLTKQIPIQAHSNNANRPIAIAEPIAVITTGAAPRQVQQVTITVGGKSVTGQFVVKFAGAVSFYAATGDANVKAYLYPYIIQNLQKEFEAKADYASGTSLLEELVAAVSTMTPQQKAQMSAIQPQIKAIYGAAPKWALKSTKERYQAVMALVERI